MQLKTGYRMRRADWYNLVEACGGTIMGSRFRTAEKLMPRSLPTAVKAPAVKARGGFRFQGGRLLRTAGRGK